MTHTYCGRRFTDAELARVRELAASLPTRMAISRAVCRELDWRKPDGGLKDMSCRVALLRMARDGHLVLPPPRARHVSPPRHAAGEPLPAALRPEPVQGSRADFPDLTLQPVAQRTADSRLWNTVMQRYHYLGYAPLPGAQMRYLLYGRGRLLGALGFGAAAWKLAPRDDFIGWSPEQRQARLHLIVNNARFVLLPWVTIRFLASSTLALAVRRLPADWRARYGYEPVLCESFVERPRFTGTCYRAANWVLVGQTQGRGKLDRHHRRAEPVKDIYLYPLRPDFRARLTAPTPAATDEGCLRPGGNPPVCVVDRER